MGAGVTRALCAVLAVLAFMAGARAADAASASRGRTLAAAWCAGCHQTAATEPASDRAPSFVTLAETRGEDLAYVRAWLFDPHPPMEGIRLSSHEIDDVVAYLQSLSAATPIEP
jgi:mono/diheme cytochrome c family protein